LPVAQLPVQYFSTAMRGPSLQSPQLHMTQAQNDNQGIRLLGFNEDPASTARLFAQSER
jgi:hypothetical protein